MKPLQLKIRNYIEINGFKNNSNKKKRIKTNKKEKNKQNSNRVA